MLITQTLFILLIYLLLNYTLYATIKTFNTKQRTFLALYIAIALYTLGFVLRLTTQKWLIDIGFFLTNIANFFTTIIFTLALLLGQLKYWKKS